jgi:hypothetical protein
MEEREDFLKELLEHKIVDFCLDVRRLPKSYADPVS